MGDQPSIAELCRPLSAKVQPALHRDPWPTGISELVPTPRIRPVSRDQSPSIMVAPVAQTKSARIAPLSANAARSRHDPAVAASRAAVRAAYDGQRTTRQIAELTGLNRRTVFDHLRALGLQPIKGQAGPSHENPARRNTLARRDKVRMMVAEGKSGPAIAELLGVKISTIHADCIALGIRIPRGTGRDPRIMEKARQAAAAKRRAASHTARIAKAEADLCKALQAAQGAISALKDLGITHDDLAERLRSAVLVAAT